jgi:hypothetical protein
MTDKPVNKLTKRDHDALRKEYFLELEGLIDVEGGKKCPRCYRLTAEGHANFDGLCDRCCQFMIEHFPNNKRTAGVLASFEAQRNWAPEQWRAINHLIDPVRWPLR